MPFSSFVCRPSSICASSLSFTPKKNHRRQSPLRSRVPHRAPLWTPVARTRQGSRRGVPTCPIRASHNNGRRGDWKRSAVAAAVPGFAVTLGGVTGSTSLKQCLQNMKSLASGGDGNGSALDGSGGGGGGGGGQEIFQLAVTDDEEDEPEEEVEEEDEEFEEGEIEEFYEDDLDEEDYVDPTAPFECNKVTAIGLPSGPGVPREADIFAGINCQTGFRCTQEELRKDLKTLSQYVFCRGCV